MTITSTQQTELEKPVTRVAYFVEFYFTSSTIRLSSLGQTVSWGGYDWIGFGTIGNISSIDESLGVSASSLTFSLNIAQPEWLALSVGITSEYRGLDAKLYFCPLDEQFRIIDTPVICWRGTMDTMMASIDGDRGETTASISLKCETSAYGLKRKPAMRLNAAQQKQKYPTDTGFDYLVDLLGNPDSQVWLSKRFQS